MLRPCEVCGVDISQDRGRCTNGRCSKCHKEYCTEGGETSPGHNRRWPKGHANYREPKPNITKSPPLGGIMKKRLKILAPLALLLASCTGAPTAPEVPRPWLETTVRRPCTTSAIYHTGEVFDSVTVCVSPK